MTTSSSNPQPSFSSSTQSTSDENDDAVVNAAKQFMLLLDSGAAPNVDQFCCQHPEIASQLRPTLEGLVLVHNQEMVPPKSSNNTLGSASSNDKELPGKPIGDFQIIGEIGRGGMGVVYEAIQLSLNRRVALKVLPFASGLDNVRLQRFRNEAHAAAGLHHTNIVPVYAVGSDRGIHYYAMQMIDGHTLAELIERMRSSQSASTPDGIIRSPATPNSPASKSPSSKLPTSHETGNSTNTKANSASAKSLDETFRQASSTLLKNNLARNHYFESVVEMVVQSAQALEHAHQYGVVHRDIKPANLLLDQSGKIWVTDFGLAQIQHADGQLTRSGDQVGTLRYMSPEQASGNRDLLDHRCDIYSLGITLYELLTLKPAIEGENYRQMLNQVAEHEPIAPRAINAAIPLDLETIVRKAIAKEPAHRYASAQALADDLKRWLDNKPIVAKPPAVWQRLAKWRQRNSLLVNMAGILLALLSVGLLATTLIVLQQQRATKLALSNEINQRNIAEQNFQQARKAVDTFSELSESELAFRPEVQTLRRKILETSLEFYRSFLDQRKEDPQMSQELTLVSEKAERILNELRLIQESSLYSLLDNPRVLADLEVEDALAAKIEQALVDFHNNQGDSMDFGDMQYAAINASSIEQMKHFIELARTLLSKDQNERLKQISYQLQLPFTFTSDEIVELLELSTSQRQMIYKIIMDHRPDKRRDAPGAAPPTNFGQRNGRPPQNTDRANGLGDFRGGSEHRRAPGFPRSGDPRPGDPRMNDIRRATVDHILREALTTAQRSKWQLLIGEPFEQGTDSRP